MAKKHPSTTALMSQLLAPLPEGERMEEQAFDADSWIARLRAAGGDCRMDYLHERAVVAVDPDNAEQMAIFAEANNPADRLEIAPALRARRALDSAEYWMKLIIQYGEKLRVGDDEAVARIKFHFLNQFAEKARSLGVDEDRILAAAQGGLA